MLRGLGVSTYVPLRRPWRITHSSCKIVITNMSRSGLMARHISVGFEGGAWWVAC
jgi:hypothetical protein